MRFTFFKLFPTLKNVHFLSFHECYPHLRTPSYIILCSAHTFLWSLMNLVSNFFFQFLPFLKAVTLVTCKFFLLLWPPQVGRASILEMSGSTAVKAAIFAAGALVGGGVTAFVTSRYQPTSNRPLLGVSTSPAPTVVFDEASKAKSVDVGIAPPSLLSPILKFGRPGQYQQCFRPFMATFPRTIARSNRRPAIT